MGTKARQLETELDLTTEKLGIATLQLEEKEKQLAASELEMNALNRRVSGLEEALEKAEAADATYDDVAKKLATCEGDLEKAEERADVGEDKIIELEEELRVVANNLKSLEVAEEKANQREKTYKEQIKTLSAKLKQAEARAEFAEK